MRLWSLHPCYLDTKGLLALWREALLAKNVLEGMTKGYKNHPQLDRFKKYGPEFIHPFLQVVYEEAHARGYRFDQSKFNKLSFSTPIPVTTGQIAFEKEHLLRKLQERAPGWIKNLEITQNPRLNPLFIRVDGEIEPWERA
ncbi:pyrimidine dimer DNA glycosylase/endonuclease V [Leadbetterella byssophila]|uniref:pyrimidine dimer DNA glycosylase/endonuclease V n=1 Tax=Leadbetterella byssophila TaxID=316068 RepID=UPI00399FB03F